MAPRAKPRTKPRTKPKYYGEYPRPGQDIHKLQGEGWKATAASPYYNYQTAMSEARGGQQRTWSRHMVTKRRNTLGLRYKGKYPSWLYYIWIKLT